MTDDEVEDWSQDPGWRPSWQTLLLTMPYVRLVYRRRSHGDQLIDLRNVWASFPLTLVAFGVVLPLILPFHTGSGAIFWLLGIALLTVLTTIVVTRIVRPLPCDSDAKLAAGFKTRMFLRGSRTPIRLRSSGSWRRSSPGVVGSITSASSWRRRVSSAPRPTRAALTREQDELNARGCGRSLVAALRQTPAR